MLILIEPYTRHRLRSAGGVRTLVLGIPAWHPDDEYFD
jgi:mannose-6-phosphate isomerase-like protein (cupin superfamily)